MLHVVLPHVLLNNFINTRKRQPLKITTERNQYECKNPIIRYKRWLYIKKWMFSYKKNNITWYFWRFLVFWSQSNVGKILLCFSSINFTFEPSYELENAPQISANHIREFEKVIVGYIISVVNSGNQTNSFCSSVVIISLFSFYLLTYLYNYLALHLFMTLLDIL